MLHRLRKIKITGLGADLNPTVLKIEERGVQYAFCWGTVKVAAMTD